MAILVVDDDDMMREYTCSMLVQSGYSVVEASDGTVALEKLKSTTPDCIVLDLVMPGLSGFDTLRTMHKEHPNLPPVIVMTSIDGGGTRTYALKVNKADAFLTKAEIEDPANGLIAQVRRVMRR